MFVGTAEAAERAGLQGRRQKGNEKRETRRNSLPLELARSLKGNVKRETRRNPLLLELARS